VQWNTTFHNLVRPGDLCSTQTPSNSDFHTDGSCLHSPLERTPERPSVSHTTLKLLRYVTGYQIRVHFRLSYLLNIQSGPLSRYALYFCSQFVYSLATPSNYNPRTSSINSHDQILGSSIDSDERYRAAVATTINDESPDSMILHYQTTVARSLLCEPLRLPILYSAQAEPNRVGFLAQLSIPHHDLTYVPSSSTSTVRWLVG